jgi:hypothetical protein
MLVTIWLEQKEQSSRQGATQCRQPVRRAYQLVVNTYVTKFDTIANGQVDDIAMSSSK